MKIYSHELTAVKRCCICLQVKEITPKVLKWVSPESREELDIKTDVCQDCIEKHSIKDWFPPD